jgi:hypothetical protein
MNDDEALDTSRMSPRNVSDSIWNLVGAFQDKRLRAKYSVVLVAVFIPCVKISETK